MTERASRQGRDGGRSGSGIGSLPPRGFLPATLIIVVIIVHGSLYPYDFQASPGGIGAVATLLGSWDQGPSSYGNLVANVLLYTPFGFFAGMTVRGGHFRRLLIVTLLGMALCTSIELAQYYDVGRDDSMSDVYLNTSGSALGCSAAIAFGFSTRLLPIGGLVANPFPALLLTAMLGYHLFPYVPTIDMHKYWLALRPLLVAPHLLPHDVVRYAALWLTASCLIGEITGFAWSRLFAPLFMAGVFGAKVAIVDLVVTPSEVAGAALALMLWLSFGRRRRFAIGITAALLCGSLVIARLEPFQFQALARPFGWVPFRALIHGSRAINTISLLEKFFLYGSLVWLVVEALFPLWLSTALVALLLFATSVAERYLPGRSAEVTDAVVVLIIGLLMVPFRRRQRADDAKSTEYPASVQRGAKAAATRSEHINGG